MKASTSLAAAVACLGALFVGAAPAQAGQAFAACHVVDVASFNNRVHIHCEAPVSACSLTPGGCPKGAGAPPTYVAAEANSPMASTTVQIGLAAIVSKREVNIFYDDSTSANPAGCNANDCRRLIGIVIR